MFAPIFRSGVITRSMGRRETPASPTRRLSNVCPASKPARSRMVVPEFPQSISSFGGVSTRFFPWTMRVSGSGCSILIPKARSAFTVRMQSLLGRKPRNAQTPLDKAAMMAARWEMLLSPGTVISVSIRGARFTRSSIGSVPKLFAQPAQPHGIQSHLPMSIGYKMRLSSGSGNSWCDFAQPTCQRGAELGNEKDFARVRVLHLRTWSESLHVHLFTGRKGTLHHVWFARNGNSVWKVSFRHFRPRSCWRGRWGHFLGRGIFRRRGVRVERLLLRRILLAFRRVIGGAVTGTWRRLLHVSTRRDKEGS